MMSKDGKVLAAGDLVEVRLFGGMRTALVLSTNDGEVDVLINRLESWDGQRPNCIQVLTLLSVTKLIVRKKP